MTDFDQIASLLRYDHETGLLFWRVRRGKQRAGSVAGHSSRRGYVMVRVLNRIVCAHRVAWLLQTGAWPVHEIDHINGQKGDNRFANLRDVSRSVNHQNRTSARRGSKTGLLGARYSERRGHYFSEIKAADGYRYLGSFHTAQAAHEAYVAAKRQLHEGCTL